MNKLMPLVIVLSAVLFVVGALGMLAPVAHAQDATATPPAPGAEVTPPAPADPAVPAGAQYTGPQKCEACHPAQAEAWKNAPHANAYKVQAFVEAWQKAKSPGYCLGCHTTGYDPNTGQFVAEGVTCESCHGPFVEGHPQKAMAVNSSPEACGVCHRSTLNEWQLSKHGLARIGCVSCHDSHGQQIKAGDATQLCGKCHPDQAKGGNHASSTGQSLTCADCHIGPRTGDPSEGHANTGHTFMVGTSTCSRCHGVEVHKGVAVMMGNATPDAKPTLEPAATPVPVGGDTPTNSGSTSVALPTLLSGAVGLGLGVLWSRSRTKKS